MFNSSDIYHLFKPLNNERLITDFEVVVGGTALSANLEKGAIIVNVLNSLDLSSNYKNILDKEQLLKDETIKEFSILENTYQIDIYKENAKNINYIEVEREAYKIKEWLKSYETSEYLKKLNSEILPCYSNITFINELYNKKFINRASFTFQIIIKNVIFERVNLIENVIIEKQSLL